MRTLTAAKGVWKGVPDSDLSALLSSDSTPFQAVRRLSFVVEFMVKVCARRLSGGDIGGVAWLEGFEYFRTSVGQF